MKYQKIGIQTDRQSVSANRRAGPSDPRAGIVRTNCTFPYRRPPPPWEPPPPPWKLLPPLAEGAERYPPPEDGAER